MLIQILGSFVSQIGRLRGVRGGGRGNEEEEGNEPIREELRHLENSGPGCHYLPLDGSGIAAALAPS